MPVMKFLVPALGVNVASSIVVLLLSGSATGQESVEAAPDQLLLKDYQPKSIYKRTGHSGEKLASQ